MIDMTAVDREVRAARAELADPGNTKGILSLPTRKRIWRAMLDPADDEVSYQHRIRLKMACVRHILPVWYRGFPGDQRVEEAIVFTQDLMGRRVTDIRQARRFAENLLDSVMNDLSSSVTEVEPGLLKPDATKEASCSRWRKWWKLLDVLIGQTGWSV